MANTPRQILWMAGLFAAGCQILVMPSFHAYAAKSVLLEQSSDAFLKKWLTQDVAYIASEAEKAAYLNLASDQARYEFIERFWQQRDPSPGTTENEFRDEHYLRIAYSNARFHAAEPGWKTDRGRIYITWGPPDQIESHPSGNGGPAPFEIWRYRAGSSSPASSERTLKFGGVDYNLLEK